MICSYSKHIYVKLSQVRKVEHSVMAAIRTMAEYRQDELGAAVRRCRVEPYLTLS